MLVSVSQSDKKAENEENVRVLMAAEIRLLLPMFLWHVAGVFTDEAVACGCIALLVMIFWFPLQFVQLVGILYAWFQLRHLATRDA